MKAMFLTLAVLAGHGTSQGELLMTIVSPRHNEALQSSAIGQGLGLEVTIAVEEDEVCSFIVSLQAQTFARSSPGVMHTPGFVHA